ncbi:MAG: hypothetical protein S4CHLAM102_05950 [Chlamydiia bacterium]|nr:hypothetical protein [Chlamydiia bacterium]
MKKILKNSDLHQKENLDHLKDGKPIYLAHADDKTYKMLEQYLPAHMRHSHGVSALRVDHKRRRAYQVNLEKYDPKLERLVEPTDDEKEDFRRKMVARYELESQAPNTSGSDFFHPGDPGDGIESRNRWTFTFTTWRLTGSTSHTPQFALKIQNVVWVATANQSQSPANNQYYYLLSASTEIAPPQTGIDTGRPLTYSSTSDFYADTISLQFESIDRRENTRASTLRPSFGTLLYSQCQPKNSNPGSGTSESKSVGLQYYTSSEFSLGVDLPSRKPFPQFTYVEEISSVQSTDNSYTTSSDTEFIIHSHYPQAFEQFNPNWKRLAPPPASAGASAGPRIGGTATWSTANDINIKNPSQTSQPQHSEWTTAGIDVHVSWTYGVRNNSMGTTINGLVDIGIGSLNRFLPIPSPSDYIDDVTGLNGQSMCFLQKAGSLEHPPSGGVPRRRNLFPDRTGLKIPAKGPDSHLDSDDGDTAFCTYYAAPVNVYIKKDSSYQNVSIPDPVNLYFFISAKKTDGTPITAPNLKIFEHPVLRVSHGEDIVVRPELPEQLVPVEHNSGGSLYYWTLPKDFSQSYKEFLIMNDDPGTDMIINLAIGHTQGTNDDDFAMIYATQAMFLRAPQPT